MKRTRCDIKQEPETVTCGPLYKQHPSASPVRAQLVLIFRVGAICELKNHGSFYFARSTFEKYIKFAQGTCPYNPWKVADKTPCRCVLLAPWKGCLGRVHGIPWNVKFGIALLYSSVTNTRWNLFHLKKKSCSEVALHNRLYRTLVAPICDVRHQWRWKRGRRRRWWSKQWWRWRKSGLEWRMQNTHIECNKSQTCNTNTKQFLNMMHAFTNPIS